MSAHLSAHGRLARDPEQRTTKSGKNMTLASIAVDVTAANATDQETLWLSLLAFGDQAEALARCKAGESISVIGRLTKGRYVTKNGEERESWSCLVDAVITARSSRPGQKAQSRGQGQTPTRREPDWNDELAF